jgi:hypothetical protein
MKQKTNLIIFILFVILTVVSCDRPICSNKNPVFDKYDINSFEYKTELLKQIEKIGQKNLSYWFESYIKENEKEYIIINIKNNSLCAKGKILVKDWNKIEEIKRTSGQSYVGAKLKGLTFNIENDSNKIELIYKDITRIVD